MACPEGIEVQDERKKKKKKKKNRATETKLGWLNAKRGAERSATRRQTSTI